MPCISDGQLAAEDPKVEDADKKRDKPGAIGNIGYLTL